ncbi:MAG: hypothetical protein V1787_05030 [Candidatus Micrarchaeota archaeon]
MDKLRHATFAFLLLLSLAQSAAVVLVNSNNWQDVYAASIYAQNKGLPLRYVQDIAHSAAALEELGTLKAATVELYGRIDNPVPSLTYRLRQLDLDVRDTPYQDHYELSAILAQKTGSQEVILVRDDFAFDALSARYLAVTRKAPILYARGVRELPQKVRDAIDSLRPSRIYAVGRLDDSVLNELRAYDVQVLNGKDEYDTSYYVNDYAFSLAKPAQAFLVNGDLLEITLLNAQTNPFLLVPDVGTYSLIQTSDLIQRSGMDFLLGIGQGIASPAYFIKDRTGAKVFIKFGSLSTGGNDAMTRQDIDLRLEGYRLPTPKYSGRIARLDADFGKTLGKMTAAVVGDRDKPAPPVDFVATFENTGNIEIPVYVLFKVTDQQGNTLTTIQSDPHAVYQQQFRDFKASWANPPAEGEYRVEATFFTDVYSGILFPGRTLDFDLKWLYVYLFLFIFLLAVLMLIVISYQSRRLLKDLADFTASAKRLEAVYEDLSRKISRIFR